MDGQAFERIGEAGAKFFGCLPWLLLLLLLIGGSFGTLITWLLMR